MRVRETGKILDNLWLLGREESCVYLLQGTRDSMIVSGGMSYIVPDVLQQFEEFGIDEERITKLLILHSHFDHVGIIPFLKRRISGLTLYGSGRAWEILHMPKAIKTINAFSRTVASRVGREEVYTTHDLEWCESIEGQSVSEGDIMDLGDLSGYIYETPGHSSCSISFYVPKIKALFVSDGAGIPYGETILASGNSDFTKYQESLERLKDLDVKYICADHFGYITGEEARHFIKKSIDAARDFRGQIEDVYRQTGDIDSTVKILTDSFYRFNKGYFLAPEIMEGVNRQMVRHVAGTIGKGL